MIWKSVWHVMSTDLLTQLAMTVVGLALASVGVYIASPVAWALTTIAAFLLIYRLRYKRL